MASKNSALTRREFDEAIKNLDLVSKVDLKALALVLREDIRAMDFATKTDLREALKPIALHLIKHDGELQEIRENMLTKKDGDRIMNRLDSIAEWILVSKDKEPVQDHRLLELESKTSDHDARLESK